MAGYSGTPLAKKLGIKAGFVMNLVNAPEHYFDLFTDLPCELLFEDDIEVKKDFIHFFTKEREEYITRLPSFKNQLKPNGMIWISWPKKSSKVITILLKILSGITPCKLGWLT